MGLPYGENFIILTSTVFVWSTRLTDGRAIAYTRYNMYAVTRHILLSWLTSHKIVIPIDFLVADRTNDRAYATVLRPSVVVCETVTLCIVTIVTKRCVLEQKLLLTDYRKLYEKSIGTKMNDLDLCLAVLSRSSQP